MRERQRQSQCLICEAWALDDLCPIHQAMVERDPPEVLVKRTPPKGNEGHASPDWLWTVALILFIIFLLDRLGVFR